MGWATFFIRHYYTITKGNKEMIIILNKNEYRDDRDTMTSNIFKQINRMLSFYNIRTVYEVMYCDIKIGARNIS